MKGKKERIKRLWKTTKVLSVILLMLAIIVSSQRTDIDEISTTYSEMSEYSSIFYNTTGNDSILYFDSDIYDTHLLTLDGPSGNVTVDKGNLSVNENITANNFFGDGGNLTGIKSFTYSEWFNQNLNTTNDVQFENITATEIHMTNLTYTWNMYIDTNGTLVWEME